MKHINLLLLLILFSCFSLSLFAQAITGHVFDRETKKPVANANVYLENTSYYSVTDEKGYFHITISKPIDTRLIVSHLIYGKLIFNPPFKELPETIYLDEKMNELDEITVNSGKKGSKYSWKRKITTFRRLFLGETYAGKSCRIINEGDLELVYDSESKIFSAKSKKPIIVENKYLGYKVQVELEDFRVQYMDNSLLDRSILYIDYYAIPLFVDLRPLHKPTEKRRKEVYEYGMGYLFRNLVNHTLKQTRYVFKKNDVYIDADLCFTVTDTLSVKKVQMNPVLSGYKAGKSYPKPVLGQLKLKYNNVYESEILFFTDVFYVDNFGRIIPTEEAKFGILFDGFMGNLRVGDWLPLDYEPD